MSFSAEEAEEVLHVLFLQGTPSSFFRRLGRALAEKGCRVSRINLCIGDWLFWHGPETVSYRGTLRCWPDYITDYLQRERVTDLVLLGEQRRYHKEAVIAAQGLGVRVTVTDFGYLRPDWITLERDGMSANSRFPRDPGGIRALAEDSNSLEVCPIFSDSTWAMALGDVVYSFATVFDFGFFPGYRRSDMRPHPLMYFPAVGLQLIKRWLIDKSVSAEVSRLIASGTPYYIFPLQLEHDFQIVAYSPFGGLDEAIEVAIRSFAAHAPPQSCLVFKLHPWDPGLTRWHRVVQRLAVQYCAEDRTVFFPCGDLDTMIRGASGMVTVNSTSGLRAIQMGCPVKVLGSAVYDVMGLCDQSPLDDFWGKPLLPDTALTDMLLRALAATIQIRGVFFKEPGMSAAISAATERLLTKRVGLPIRRDRGG